MNTSRLTSRQIRTAAAVTVAALIGTAGLAAAAASGGGTSSSSTAPIEIDRTDADPDDTAAATAPASDDVPTTDAPSATVAARPETTAPADTVVDVDATPANDDPSDDHDPSGDGHLEPGDPGEEPDLPGVVPGAIDGPDDPEPDPPAPEPGPTEYLLPVDKPLPQPTVPGPTDLLPGIGGDPDPTPIDGPSDFRVTPLPPHLGTITSGLEGCQLECVTRAQLISNGVTPNVVLEIDATLPVHAEIEITEVGTDSSFHIGKSGYDSEWAIPISPLEPDTQYELELIVIDQDGHSKVFEHHFTTVDVIDGFAGNATGCALHCITEGSVAKTDHHSTVELHVETNTPARLDVWVSTSEPGTIGGNPLLPLEAKVYENPNPATSTTFDVTGLAADTTYHVVARAEDDHGVDYRVGTFHTDDIPLTQLTVGFEKIRLTYDGDKWKSNRGEVSFRWGVDGYTVGNRAEEKMHAPKDIVLSSHNTASFLVPAEGWSIPWIGVSAAERDWDGKAEFCAAGLGVASEPIYLPDCDTRVNVARTPGDVTQADLDTALPCHQYGVTGDRADLPCLFLEAPWQNDEYATFVAMVSVDVG
ncbi:hypothetical protein BDK89_4271 [Ilumatobacter fluminis]|uniref:Fibronectin type-III domain-containing protein n=1 Tax=Ilumatobacter fluminis TaxID=467091 RepID=A0A4R7I759_9ACTN|nr:hypothetical protein [Ilumatobacter fluminis]TDT18643.1 hypothetical protein BDK89_4271 [Ilumatobacter fluminis]